MMKKLGTSRNLEIDATDGSKTAVKASAKNEFAFFHGQLNFTSLRVVQYVNVGKFSWSWIPGSKSRVRISFFVGSLTVVQCASKKSTKMLKCRMHMQSCCFFGHESKCFLTFSMRWLLPRLLLLWKLIKNYTVSRLPKKQTSTKDRSPVCWCLSSCLLTKNKAMSVLAC